MKTIIFMIALAGIFFSPCIGQSQELSSRDRAIYLEIVEQVYTTDLSEDVIYSQIASKYNLTMDEVYTIDDIGIMQEITPWEWSIIDELDRKFAALPQNASRAEYEKIFSSVAEQFNIDIITVYELDYRASWGWFFFSNDHTYTPSSVSKRLIVERDLSKRFNPSFSL